MRRDHAVRGSHQHVVPMEISHPEFNTDRAAIQITAPLPADPSGTASFTCEKRFVTWANRLVWRGQRHDGAKKEDG
jgi:hypothetical protein